eukprot:CAMPEP_0197279382 /NCGR_PEP_ID=MMETSP1432-20130617/20018_1 /TAXON_ID=44447 /ORGANISM="Pseudo-nitzschia delicatissima, Strain UNC1205" /LENGTH=215 /DNA_ID=CAMNT_0042745917 /DNA_START=200 /DNA_END=847 /DNA_ORIENTATION=-
MISLRGISRAVTPMVSLVEASTAAVARPRALAQTATSSSKRRAYHGLKPSFRIHSALQQQNHMRKGTKPLAQVSPPFTTTVRWHGGPDIDHHHADSIHVSFVDADGNFLKEEVDAYIGESLLQVAQRNDIELEGACEGVCACSTCHVIFEEKIFDNLLEEASEDEEDMLDMAYGLTETSRLGCQITVTPEMDGMKVEIPPATRNFYVDGHVPKPH